MKFLICHLGNPWFRDCMEVVYKNDNVYTDISGLTLGQFTDRFEAYMRQQLKEMLSLGRQSQQGALRHRLADLRRWSPTWTSWTSCTLPRRRQDTMLFENAARLFKLDVVPRTAGLRSLLNRI